VIAVGRFLSGIGAGAAVVVVPIYISETAPPKEKGVFGALTQVMINLGILAAQLLGYFLSRGQLWRIILAVAGLIGVIQTAALFFVPESPKWMADHGYPQAAKKCLRKIRGHGVDIDEEVNGWGLSNAAEREDEEETLLDNRSHHSDSSNSKKSSYKPLVGIFDIVWDPDYHSAIIAVIGVMLAQQLCGINSIVMYSVSILSDLLKSNAALLTVFVSLVNFIATMAFAPLVDRLGRKICLLLSIAGMGVNSLLLAISIVYSIPILSAVSTLLFVMSFAVGLGPVPFILASELVGPEAVGATQSWALAANWIATFLVAQFFPILNNAMGKGKIFFLFTGLAALFFGFVTWRVPETMGKKDANEVWGRERRDD